MSSLHSDGAAPDRRAASLAILALGAASALLLLQCERDEPAAAAADPPEIIYPFDETIFPPDIAPPTFRWKGRSGEGIAWSITVEGEGGPPAVSARTEEERWTPSDAEWAAIKEVSREKAVRVTIREEQSPGPGAPAAEASITITTSSDEVGAPLFYREVNLPFVDAVKDPSSIRWRFGPVSSKGPPPVVLEKLPVCGNCHSFSADGSIIGMDVDYANDKGSYFLSEVAREIPLDGAHIITWADFRREEGDLTFGLLSQVSPDGRYAISTVRDRSVFVPMPELDFSQLFFPVKGILVFYDRQERAFSALAGADDPSYVQSNPAWSPDGEQLLFARSRAHELKNVGDKVLLTQEDCREFIEGGKTFLYDIYRVPWNGGEGGRAEPLEGASQNGMSNFFPRYSPDGRWIVFCKARSFMLLQPDSELYIMPAEGGTPRRMRCNLPRMNSWHSWSQNGRWLVWSSKPEGPYTQLFLTHIDEEGRSSPPVLLDRMVSPDRAANIPEFVAAGPRAIVKLHERFVDELSYLRAGNELLKGDAPEDAERAFRKALALNPDHADSLNNLGYLLMHTGRVEEATELLERAVKLRPDAPEANNNLGFLLLKTGQLERGKACLTAFLKHRPEDHVALANLGYAYEHLGDRVKARALYEKSLRHAPGYENAHCLLGKLLRSTGDHEAAKAHLDRCR